MLRAAAALFAAKGFAAASVSQLARRAGLSKPGIYYHVRDKEQLLFQICEYCVTGILERARAAVAATDDPRAQLRGLVRAHIRFYWQHPRELAILFSQTGFLSPRRRKHVVAMQREYLDLVRRVLRDGQRRGVLRRVDPTVAAFSLFAMLNTLDGWYDPRGPIRPDKLGAELERLYFDGLAAPTPRRQPHVVPVPRPRRRSRSPIGR